MKPEALRALPVREATALDMPFVSHSWLRTWCRSQELRAVASRKRRGVFDALVRYGALGDEMTRVLVASAPQDPTWVWAWLCYTPGARPAVHYAITRLAIRDDYGEIGMRRRGALGQLIAAAGLSGNIVYTARPESRALELALVEASERRGLSPVYQPLAEWVRERGTL